MSRWSNDSAVDASVTVDSQGRLDIRVSRCEGDSGCMGYPYMIDGSGSQTPLRPGVAGQLGAVIGIGVSGNED